MRRKDKAFDFAGEVEGIGIGIYEFVGRVGLTLRLTIFCPKRFRLLYLRDQRSGEDAPRQIAREIPYFLFAYALTIVLVLLLDKLALKIIDGAEAGLGDDLPFLKTISDNLLEMDVLTWAFVLIPVLVGLHYGILIFDRIVRNRRPHPRQFTYDPGAVIVYFAANNVVLPTMAVIQFILVMPMAETYIVADGSIGLLWSLSAILVFLISAAVVLLTPLLLLINSFSFIRTMAAIYGVARLTFIFRALLATIPLGFIGLTLYLVIGSIFVFLNAPVPDLPTPVDE